MIRLYRFLFALLPFGSFCLCTNNQPLVPGNDISTVLSTTPGSNDSAIKAIHVFVALCDNKYQGIVPVPASIGNGKDPKTNLYWGCSNGIKSYFKRSKDWKIISSQLNPSPNILERLLFKHTAKNIYLLADAYDGQFIKKTTIDFLGASSGQNEIEMKEGQKKIYFGGASDLLAYIGHDGLMDFSLQQKFESSGSRKREAIILACYSKNYFSSHLKATGASPLLWTSGLMCPEAYTLHDAIHEWVNDKPGPTIRLAAAKAYSRYQHCSIKAAQNLLVQGW
ncbi:MAG TPA: hypothetical protein VFI06_01710 [Chitinophagaceae bacterium]|nr:hypothetical protein [Chitinophagaceae bacterium]